jgi:iron complex outermembrane receptor protein
MSLATRKAASTRKRLFHFHAGDTLVMRRILLVLIILTLSHQPILATTLQGRVTDTVTGAPLQGVNLQIQGLSTAAQTNPEGRYEIERLKPGVYTVTASHIGYASVTEKIRMDNTGINLNISLKMVSLPGQSVTVTATRAVERETPITFSNLTRKELEDRFHTQGIPTLLSELPSSTTYSESGNNVGYTYLTMRGFDQRRISVMINGVPQNDPEDHNVYWVNFPDLASSLEDIQVQRGSGSAFYGPAAIGGSINLVTDRFSPKPTLTLTGGYGSYDTRKVGLTLNSGLLDDRLALHAHFSKTQSDGYRNGAWLDFLSYFFGAAHYTERSTTRLHVYGSLNRDHLNFYGIPGSDLSDRALRRQNPIVGKDEIEDFHQPHYELLHELTLSPQTKINNTIFYVQGGGFFDFDGSWADTTYYRLTGEFGFSPIANPGQSLVRAFVNNRQAGWLPRITYSTDKATTDAGLELRYHRSLHWGKVRWAENLPPESVPEFRFYQYNGSKWVLSTYLNQTFKPTPKLNLRGGIQIAHKRYRLYNEKFLSTQFTVPYTFLNPQIGINYNLSPRLNVYTNFSRTTREPRLQNLYDAASSSGGAQPEFERSSDGLSFDFERPLARPEKLNDFELGTMYSASKLRASLNFFWMDFQDEIVKNGQLDLFGQPVTGNADKTLHRGIEITTALRPAQHLTLQGNLSYSRNTFRSHTIYSGNQPIALDGNRIAGFPDLLLNGRATFERNGFLAALAVQYLGKQYTDNSENNKKTPDVYQTPGYQDLSTDPSTVLNFSLGYDLGPQVGMKRFQIRLDLNNILDRLYTTHGEGASFFPAATRNLFLWTSIDI